MATSTETRSEATPLAAEGMISGGHLVAKALKAEGIDAIFTLCGGHIIDIYDGCIDEGIKVIDVRHEQVAAHAADGYARVTGRPGLRRGHGRPRHDRCADRRRERLPRREPDAADRRPGRAQPAQDGIAAGPAARRHHAAGHQVLLERASRPSASPTWSRWPSARRYRRRPGPSFLEIGRDILDAHVPIENAVIPEAGPLPRVDQEHRRPRTTSTASPTSSPRRSGRACCSAARSGPRGPRTRRSSSPGRSTSRSS